MTGESSFNPQQFVDALLRQPKELAGSSEALSFKGVDLCQQISVSEGDALYHLPADRLYELPDFVEVCGTRSNLVAQAL